MQWANEDVPGVDQLIEYEARVDELFGRPPDAVICAYDVDRCSASRIATILTNHGAAFIDGELRPRDGSRRLSARDRILAAASSLFAEAGVRATGVDRLIEAAGVAKATFYRQFPSKDDLIVAWLQDARTRWFDGVRATAEALATSPTEVIAYIFDGTAQWLEDEDFRGCPYLTTPFEVHDPHPAIRVTSAYHDEIEHYFQEVARNAGRVDADRVAAGLHALLAGAISLGVACRTTAFVSAAREAALQLIEPERNRD